MARRFMRLEDVPMTTPADVKCLRTIVGGATIEAEPDQVAAHAARRMAFHDRLIANGYRRLPEDQQPATGVLLVHPDEGLYAVG